MSVPDPPHSELAVHPQKNRSAPTLGVESTTTLSAESTKPQVWIGVIDLGSSALKCMASPVSEPDDLHLVAQLPTPTLEADRQSEFIVEKLDACIEQALTALATFIAGDKSHKTSHKKVLASIALTGQIGGALLLDEQNRLISPCLTWADRRAAAEAQTFWQTFGDRFKVLLGHDLPAQTCWSAPKIRRLMKMTGQSIYETAEGGTGPTAAKVTPSLAIHTDAPHERVSCVMQLPDYAFFRLTGQLKSSPTVGISLVDQAKGQYQQAMLQWAGLCEDQLPALDGDVAIGPLTGSYAKRWQTITQQPMVPEILLAGADMYCGLYGAMACEGQAIIQAGTTEIAGVLVAKDHQPPCPKVLLRLAYPGSTDKPAARSSASSSADSSSAAEGLDVIYGSTSNGGMSLNWLAREYGVDVRDTTLWASASKLIPDPDGILFVPHVNGARSPLWCDQAAGGFVGGTACCDPPRLLLAVLQGCAMSKRSVLQAAGVMAKAGDLNGQASQQSQASQIIVAGGGARQSLANQIRADVLGRPVVARHVSDVTAAGAIAIALNHVSDHTSHHTHPGSRWLEHLHTSAGSSHFQPNPAYRATYEMLYKRYLQAEQSLLPKSEQASVRP